MEMVFIILSSLILARIVFTLAVSAFYFSKYVISFKPQALGIAHSVYEGEGADDDGDANQQAQEEDVARSLRA